MANTRQIINPGDLVMVSFPAGDKTNNPVKKFNGEQFVVKNKRNVDNKGGDRTIYELYGCASKMGVPYSFLNEQLILL